MISSITHESESSVFLPLGLILLLIMQLLVFIFIQLPDFTERQPARDFYFEQNLNTVEFPLYIKYLYRYVSQPYLYTLQQQITNNGLTQEQIYWLQRYDPFFQQYLVSGQSINDNSLYYMKWQQKRREYLQRLTKDASYELGYKPANPEWMDVVFSFFISSNLFQFFSNFMFLAMIGSSLEKKIGMMQLLSYYFLGGLVMLVSYNLFAPYSMVPMITSGGAVAGLVMALTILFYDHKVPIMMLTKNGLKYLNVRVWPILLLWILLQVILYFFFSTSIINLLPQILSMFLMAVLAFLWRVIEHHRNTSVDNLIDKQENSKKRMEQARHYIELQEFKKAKKVLYSLLDEYPGNKQILFEIFNLEKSRPQSDAYHLVAHKIFSIKESSKSTDALINLVFNNYVKRAKPSIRLNSDVFFNLMQRFRQGGYYDDANKLLNVLINHDIDGQMSELLSHEQFLLARCFLMNNNQKEADLLLKSLVLNYPNSDAAAQVKKIVSLKS